VWTGSPRAHAIRAPQTGLGGGAARGEQRIQVAGVDSRGGFIMAGSSGSWTKFISTNIIDCNFACRHQSRQSSSRRSGRPQANAWSTASQESTKGLRIRPMTTQGQPQGRSPSYDMLTSQRTSRIVQVASCHMRSILTQCELVDDLFPADYTDVAPA
jgi:hypothetical protein